MKLSSSFYFILLFTLGSCAIFKRDPQIPQRLQEHKLPGQWSNQYGKFTIWCEGQFEYYEPMKWDNMGPKNSEKGGYIRKFSGYEFKTGPFIGETHHIHRMPYQDEQGRWKLDMNEKVWWNDEMFECAKN